MQSICNDCANSELRKNKAGKMTLRYCLTKNKLVEDFTNDFTYENSPQITSCPHFSNDTERDKLIDELAMLYTAKGTVKTNNNNYKKTKNNWGVKFFGILLCIVVVYFLYRYMR